MRLADLTTPAAPRAPASGFKPGHKTMSPQTSRVKPIFYLLLGCFAAAAAFIALGWKPWRANLKIALLVFEYCILLPGLAWVYLKGRIGGTKAAEAAPWRFPALPVYIVMAISLAWFINQATFSGDESAYLFQARIFSAGHLAAEAPITDPTDHGATTEDIRIQHHMIVGGKWFGKYSPGWPAILAIGSWLNAEWIVNPLLGALILIIAYKTAALAFDDSTARLAVTILVASPFFVLNCVDFMSHTACSVFLAGAAYFFFRYRKFRRGASFLAMVLLIGIACLVRPYPAAFTGIILCGTCFWTARRRPARLLKQFSVSALAGGATLAVLLIYNKLLTGVFWPVTYALYRKSQNVTELDFSLRNILRNVLEISSVAVGETILSAFPFILVLAAYALFRDRERRVETWVLVGSFALLILAYVGLVEHSFSFIGERYYFETYFALAIAAARGWTLLVRNWNIQRHAVRVTVAAFLAIQAIQYPTYIRIARNVRQANRQVQLELAHLKIEDAVVFLKLSERFRGYDLNLNGADWKRAPVFFIKDPGADRRDTVACALGRTRWMVAGYDDSGSMPVMQNPVLSRCEHVAAGKVAPRHSLAATAR